MQCRHSEKVTCKLGEVPGEGTCTNCQKADFAYSTTPISAEFVTGLCGRGASTCRLRNLPDRETCDACVDADYPYAISRPKSLKATKAPRPK